MARVLVLGNLVMAIQYWLAQTQQSSNVIKRTFPSVHNGDVVIDSNIVIRLVASGEREKVLPDVRGACLEGDGEMNEVQLHNVSILRKFV